MAEKRFIVVTAHGELSLAEVASHLEAKGIDYRVNTFSEQAAILDSEQLSVRDVIGKLGGLYKIGSVTSVLDGDDVADIVRMKEKLDASEFYSWLDEKVKWCISIYKEKAGFDLEFPNLLQEYFKERLKKDKVKKARYILPKKTRKAYQEIISDDLVKRRIIEEGLEIIAAYISGKYYIGRTLEVVKNKEFRSRDLGRPFQNSKVSIPPKIARILVNLTGLKPGETLLDPFCGIGTILQEAVVLGVKVLGGDIDGRRVSETVKNLKWLSETYSLKMENLSNRIFKADARHLSRRLQTKVDGIATEPILLPPLKRFPSEEEADDVLRKAGEIYEDALPEMVKVLKKGGRLVLVIPYLRTNRRREKSFNLEEVFEESRLAPYHPKNLQRLKYPLMASGDRDQKVLRGIYILEKL